MFWNLVTGTVIGLVIAGIARGVTHLDYHEMPISPQR